MVFLCLLLDLISWGFRYPTNLEHATSLSLVCTSFLQEMMLHYDTLTGILFLRSLMLSIMYGWFSHPKNLMKDLVKMANKRRWRWEKKGFGGKALWNHIIKKKHVLKCRIPMVQKKKELPLLQIPMNPDVANGIEILKMPRNAGFLKDHWWTNVQIFRVALLAPASHVLCRPRHRLGSIYWYL